MEDNTNNLGKQAPNQNNLVDIINSINRQLDDIIIQLTIIASIKIDKKIPNKIQNLEDILADSLLSLSLLTKSLYMRIPDQQDDLEQVRDFIDNDIVFLIGIINALKNLKVIKESELAKYEKVLIKTQGILDILTKIISTYENIKIPDVDFDKLKKFIDSLVDILKSLHLGGLVITSPLNGIYIELLKKFTTQVQSLAEHVTKSFTPEITKGLTGAVKGIKQLLYIIAELLLIGVAAQFALTYFMFFIVHMPIIFLYLKTLKIFFKYITKLFDAEFSEEIIKAQKAIAATQSIMKSLLIESALVTAMLPLLPTTILGLIIGLVYVKMLGIFLKLVNKTIKKLGDIDVEDVEKKITAVKKIIKELIKIAGWIMILAVVAIPAMICMIIVILFVLELNLLVTLIANIFNKIDIIVLYRSVKKTEHLILMLGLIALTIILITPFVIAAMVCLIIILLFILEIKFTLKLLSNTLIGIRKLYEEVKLLEMLFLLIGVISITLIVITPIVIASMISLGILIVFAMVLKYTLNYLHKSLIGVKTLVRQLLNLIFLVLLIGLAAISLTLIAPALITGTIALGVVWTFMFTLRFVLNLVIKVFESVKIGQLYKGTAKIQSVAVCLLLISLSLIILAPSLLVGMIGMSIIWLFMFALKFTIKMMTSVFNTIKVMQIYKGTTKIQSVAVCLLLISLALIVLAPALILGMVGMLAILIFVGLLTLMIKSLNYLFKVINKLITMDMAVGILKIVGVLAIFVVLSFMIVMLGEKSREALGYMWDIIKFLGLVIALSLVLVGIGYLANLISPVMIGAMIGLGMILVLIGMVMLIAWALEKILEIKFSQKAVTDKISQIMGTATSVIDSIFDKPEPEVKEGESKSEGEGSWIANQLKSLGSGIFMVMKIILTVMYLFFVFLSIGLILLIAGCLRLLQELNLNEQTIITNVDIVLNTAQHVIDSIFERDQEDKTKGEEKKDQSFGDWIVDQLKGIMPGLFKIIEILISVIYLFFVFIAITLILAIATALRMLQTIELDATTIKDNLDIVMNSAELVITSVFNRPNPEPTEGEEKDQSFGDWIIEKLSGILGGIGKIIKIILSVIYLFFVFMAIGMIASIVKALNEIAQFNVDESTISSNVEKIFRISDLVIKKVFEQKSKPHGEPQGAIAKVLSWLGLPSEIADFMSANAYLSRIFETVGLVGKIVTELNKISGFSLKEDNITAGVKAIFDTADLVIARVNASNYTEDGLDDLEDIVDELPDVVECIVDTADQMAKIKNVSVQSGYVKDLMNAFNNISVFTAERKKQINETMTQVLKSSADLATASGNFSKYNVRNIGNDLNYLIQVTSKKISKETLDNQTKSINNYIKLLNKINGVDVANLKTAENLFKNMAQFSESINGNFQGLADSLNEKIAPLLEELRDLLKEVKPTIEDSARDINAGAAEAASGNLGAVAERAGMNPVQVQQVEQNKRKIEQEQYERLAAIDKIVKLLEGEINNGAKVRMS